MDADAQQIKAHYWALFLVLGILCLSVFLSYTWDFVADDAYGIFRYSRNIANGHGFVWNIGEEPVEGSTFLLYVVLAGMYYAGIDLVMASKIVGLLSLLGIIALFAMISRDILGRHPKQMVLLGFFVGTTVLLANPATAIHMVAGMDTMFLAFLLLGTVYSALRLINNPREKNMIIYSISALALSLLRPEGTAVAFFLLIMSYAACRSKPSFNKAKCLGIFLIIFVLPMAIYAAWKLMYFGNIFHMAFFMKTLTHGGLLRGFPTFMRVMGYLSPYLIVIVIMSLLFLENRRTAGNGKGKGMHDRKTRRKFWTFLVASVLGSMSFIPVYLFSLMAMNYAQRYYYPVFVMAYILTGISIALLHSRLSEEETGKWESLAKRLGIVISILLLVGSNVYFIGSLQDATDYANGFENGYIPLSKALGKYKDQNLTLAAIDMGALSYFSQWRFIELGGLMNTYIAKHGRATMEYMESVKPDVIIITSRRGDSYDDDIIPLLRELQVEVYEYIQENGFVMASGTKAWENYYQVPYIRPDLEVLDEMKEDIDEVAAESIKN